MPFPTVSRGRISFTSAQSMRNKSGRERLRSKLFPFISNKTKHSLNIS